MLKVEGLKFLYGGKIILNDVGFSIADGEVVSLVGPSGEGKSTLARIIAGHLPPSRGRVLIDNNDMTSRPSRSAFMVSQENDLFGWQDVHEQVSFAFKAKPGLPEVDELLALVNLDHAKNLFPKELSGGMQKRLALARALALDPRVLILDEVFGSQDETLRNELLDTLKPHWKSRKTSVLIVTHDPAVTERVAERELSLNSGEII